MEWALARSDWHHAQTILRRQGPADGVRHALADAALATHDAALEDLAFHLAPGFQLAGLLRERATSPSRWNAALDTLIRQKKTSQLLAIVEDYGGATFLPLTPAEKHERGRRLLALLHALRRVGARPPTQALTHALQSPQEKVARVAALGALGHIHTPEAQALLTAAGATPTAEDLTAHPADPRGTHLGDREAPPRRRA